MNLASHNLSMRTIRLSFLVSILSVCLCSPQRFFNNRFNYPYSVNQHAQNLQSFQFTRSNQILKHKTLNSGPGHSPKLLDNASSSFTSQSDLQKLRDNRISRADVENAKFAGATNQEENEESERAFGHLKWKKLKRQLLNPCFRSLSGKNTPTQQGRFLFDINIYNIQPWNSGYGNGCGGLAGGFGEAFGGGLGGGLLGSRPSLFSDALSDPYPPPISPFQNLLSILAPGVVQNALAVTARPQLQSPVQANQVQSDPAFGSDTDPSVDPNYNSAYNPRPQLPVRRPNRIFYDSAGAAPLTPAQLVGGVATTVNGIIQQLTGNVQPVYPSYRYG